MSLRERASELEQRRERARAMGGTEAIAKQHARHKLTARERIDLLCDPGSFAEIGMLAHAHSLHAAEVPAEKTPADGVVTGHGLIDGRLCALAAYDFTVLAGSMGMVGESKVARMRDFALRNRVPMIWLLDSAGARIQESAGSTFAGAGALFYDQVQMSGVVPQVAAMLGPCAAGTAYIPGLSDFVPMVKETSSMSLGGARLVKASTGEEVTDLEMGGSQVHCYVSGVGDLEVEDDRACLEAVREFLSYLPSNNRAAPPVRPTQDSPARQLDGLEEVVPINPRQGYDMRRLIRRIVDDDHFFEIKPTWARNIVVGFGRLNGHSVGVVANQPQHLGGILDVNAADKAARFIRMCDAFNVPLLFLQDVPGFMVGSKVEKEGIIRHGAKMLYAVSEAIVPKVTVIVRKAYGAGYFVMCGRGYQPDLIVAWPTAEISVMGPEGAVNILFNKQIEASANPDETRKAMEGEVRKTIDPYLAASWAYVDDVIDPAETRAVVIRGFERAAGKHVERPWRKHGNIPV
jgi:acetyl-CoA carboxylase carboxyltransferase component